MSRTGDFKKTIYRLCKWRSLHETNLGPMISKLHCMMHPQLTRTFEVGGKSTIPLVHSG